MFRLYTALKFLEGLIKHRFAGQSPFSPLKILIAQICNEARKFLLRKNSQLMLMLLVQAANFENHFHRMMEGCNRCMMI